MTNDHSVLLKTQGGRVWINKLEEFYKQID